MTTRKFDTLEEYLTFADQATRDGVRVGLRAGLEIDVPDSYKGMTSGQIEAAIAAEEPSPQPGHGADLEPELTKPAPSAAKSEWVAYANAREIDTTDLTKDEIIQLFEGE